MVLIAKWLSGYLLLETAYLANEFTSITGRDLAFDFSSMYIYEAWHGLTDTMMNAGSPIRVLKVKYQTGW